MGQFQLGQLKPEGSGRKRGTRNMRSEVLAIALDAVGLNVPVRLAELLPQLPPDKQADILLGLMGYLFPKRKAVERRIETVTTPPDKFANMTPEELGREQIRLYRVSAQLEEDPLIRSAYETLADYYDKKLLTACEP